MSPSVITYMQSWNLSLNRTIVRMSHTGKNSDITEKSSPRKCSANHLIIKLIKITSFNSKKVPKQLHAHRDCIHVERIIFSNFQVPMCLANVRHRTNLIPSKNFVITQIFQVWIDVVSTYLESRETKDSPNPWYPFLKYLTCSSRHSSNLQKPPKIYNQKEKEEKKGQNQMETCVHTSWNR